jgi:serine/threonine protein kinase
MRIVFPVWSSTMDLFDFISAEQHLSECLAFHILRQLVDGLLFLRDHHFFYPDVKDENLLYDPQTRQIRMIDFDHVLLLHNKGEYRRKKWEQGVIGTNVYMAPETFVRGGSTAEQMNVWSIGILLYDMLMGDVPFHEHPPATNADLQKIFHVGLPAVVEKCLRFCPSRRIPLVDLRKMIQEEDLA